MTKKRRKELARVRKFITRAEKRGYVFPEGFREGLANKTTRALQMLTPRRLYEQAKFKLSETEFVKGLRGRGIERQRAAVKGALTRARLGKTKLPKINDLIYQGVVDLMETYPSSEAYKYLKNLFDSEINMWGYDAVVRSMEDAGEDWIRRAHEILFYGGDSMKIHDALKTFADIINAGVKRNKAEAIEFNRVIESL